MHSKELLISYTSPHTVILWRTIRCI